MARADRRQAARNSRRKQPGNDDLFPVTTRGAFIGYGGDILIHKLGPLPADFQITKGHFCSAIGVLAMAGDLKRGLMELLEEDPINKADRIAKPFLVDFEKELTDAAEKLNTALLALLEEIKEGKIGN